MTEVKEQRSAVRNQWERVNRLDAKFFLSALYASAVNPIFDPRLLISALCALLFALCDPAHAQQAKIPKIGELVFRSGATLGTGREMFRRSLRELGYVDGKSVTYETRSAEGKLDRFPALAEELVRLKVDVLLTSSSDETLAAKKVTKTIPIVFVAQVDPVSAGLVDNLGAARGERHGNYD